MNDAAVIATLPQAEGILIQHPGQEQRPAQAGEALRVGDVVTNTQDAPVSVQLVDGPPLILSPQMQALVTIEWANSTRPSVDEASTDNVDPLVEAILAGADFEAELEATAAGPGATPEGEGHSFVRLERIQESVDQSDLSGVGNLPSGNSDDIGQANQAEVPDAIDDIISTPEDTPVDIDVLGNDSDPDGSPLTIVAVSAPGNGTATISPAGTSITYTPAPNSTGTDSFTYTIQDSSGNTDTATVTVNVTNVNDAPLAQPDQRLVNEDGAGVSGNVISAPQAGEQADTDPDGDSLSVVAVGFGGIAGSVGSVIAGSYGDLVVASDGSYTYVPNAAAQALDDGDTVSDVFSYTVSDGALTDTTTLSFTVTGSNDGPIAQDDLGSTPEDQPLTLAILGNDSDPDGDALSVVAINGSAISAGDSIAIANGSVTLNAGGTVTVTPAPNYNGPLSFEYTISDGDATDTATVTVNVIGVNDGPVALPDERSLSEDTAGISGNVITAPQAGEQADIDPDGDALSVVAISFGSTSGALGSVLAGNYGDLILSDDGSYTYQPNAAAQALSEGEVVRDIFAYTVSDGTATDTTTLSFSVAGSNDGPIARDDLGNTPEDTPITLAILGNDSDPEGDPLSVVTIAGNSVNPGDTVSITNGSVTFNADSTVTVTPAPNFNGTLSFTYSITDGDQSDSATVTVNINDVNDAPNALADSRTTTEDGPTLSGNVITAPQTGEQADTDPDGDVLNVTVVAFGGVTGTVGSALAGDYGTLTLNADGSYTYTPNAAAQALDDGDSVSDVFSYTVSDGASTDTTTLTITVTGSNDGPVAVNDSDSTPEDTPVTLAILGNDSDPDGDALSVVEIAGTAVTAGDSVAIANGSVTLNANGTVTVTPAPNYNGILSFEYTISDGDATDTATVTVNVSGVNDSPTAQPDVRSVGEDGPALSGNVITAPETGEQADSDPDGDVLNVTVVAFGGVTGTVGSALAGDYGTLTLNADGSYSYTPNAAAQALDDGDSVSDVFSYTVSDGASTDTTTLTITVTGSNDGPVAVNDSDSTPEDTPVTLAILGNDSDPDGDALSVVEIAGTAVTAGDSVAIANGSVTLNSNGTVTVTPAPNYNGTLSFEYTISDGDATDSATVTVNISGVNDSPTAQPDLRSVGEDGPALSGNVITAPETGEQADSDPDGDALNVSAVAFGGVTGTAGSALAGDYGTLTLNADGSYSYTPNAAAQVLDDGDSVSDVFSYTVSDGSSTDTTTLTITVTGSNDGPVAVNDSDSTPEDTPVTLAILGNDSDPDGDTLSVVEIAGTSVTAGDSVAIANGSVTLNANGTVTVTPATNYNGTLSFEYTISDGDATDTATVTVNVSGVNDSPTAQPDVRSVGEDGPALSGNVITAPETGEQADSDPDGDALNVSAVAFGGVTGTVGSALAGDYGTLTLNADGSYSYTPNAAAQALDDGDSVSDVFSYTVSDGASTDTTTLTITVTGSNDGPVAVNDSDSTPEDTPVTLAILGNDSDPDGDALSVVEIAGTAVTAGDSVAIANGSVTLNANGTVTVTPAPNYNGILSFEYTISDGDATDTATVTVNVIGVNDRPNAQADVRSVSEDGPALSGNVITAPETGEQADSDPDGDALNVSAVAFGATSGAVGSALAGDYGTLTLNADGSYSYTPSAAAQALDDGDSVSDVFSYTVSDGSSTDTTTLTITVTGSNDGPVAVNDSDSTPEDTPVTLAILGNDSDPDGDALSVVEISGTAVTAGDSVAIANGSVILNANGTVTVTPAPNYNGILSFEYTISDGDATDTATVTVNVSGVNDGPTALADSRTTTEDGPTLSGNVITAPEAGEQADTDPDGDALSVSAVAFGATSGTVGSALAGDYGTLTLNSDGSYSYTPNAAAQALDDGDSVSDVFSYTVSDGASTDTTTLTITVTGSNDGPLAVNDSDSTPEDTPVTLAILGNDSDPDGDALSVVEIAGTAVTAGDSVSIANGSVILNANGTVTVTPAPNYNGILSFEYTISDGDATDTATVTVNVSGVNDSPTAQPDVRSVGEDGPALSGNVITAPQAGEQADTDPDGDVLNVTVVAFGATSGTVGSALAGDYGTLTLNADGSYSYTPNAAAQALDDGDSVSDVFSYTVSDGASTDTTTLTITVTGSNDGPVAVNDSDSTPEDTPVTLAILGNDSDPDGDALSVVEIAGTAVTAGDSVAIANGSVTLNANGTVTVTPATNYNGTLSFEYTISDGDATDTATVTVNVSGVNDGPTALADSRTTTEDGPALSGNVITAPEAGEQTDTDPDGDTLNVTVVAFGGVTGTVGSALAGDYGSLTLNADGSYSYTPNAAAQALDDGDSVSDVFSYTVSDGASTDTTTLTITVTGSNDGPVAVNDSDSTPEDTPVTLAILGNDSDPDGDALSVVEIAGTAVTAGDSVSIANGSVTLNANGTVTVTPATNYNGTLSFEYTISDGDATDTATVTVNVSGVNDSPTAQPDVRSVGEDGPALSGNVITAPETGEQADSDPDGDALNVSAVAFGGVTGTVGSALAGDYGTLTLNADGSYSYTPNAATQALDDGDSVSDVFSYTVSDGSSTDTTTLTITVTGSNDGPVAVNDSDSTPEDTPVTLAILGNDSDPDGDALSVVEIAGTAVTAGDSVAIANGSVTLNANGTVTVTPATNYNGTLNFDYTISDGDATDTATVTVNVSGVNDAPSLSGATAAVSEEGLAGGIPDTSGNPSDTSNATQVTGQLTVGDADGDAVELSLVSPSTSLTSGGETLSWQGDNTQTLVATAGGEDIARLSIDNDGNYQFDLLRPLDHPDSTSEDVLSIDFGVVASDGQDSTTATLQINVEDDAPSADSIDQSVEFLDTNLLVVIDVSGSMGTSDGIGGQTRLNSAISAINSLMSRYAEFGDVAVRIVAFSGSAQAIGSSWTSIAQAQTDLSGLSAGGQTNYDAALNSAQTAFASNGALSNAQNIAYFFSDGRPTRPDGSRGINASEEAEWVDFLNTEFISAYAMGLGNDVNQSNLNPIAHNGESGENRDAVIVNSLADLEQTLEDTVANTTRGNLLSSGELQLLAGADGAHLSEISIDGTTYRYDISTNSVLVSGGPDRSSFDAGANQITITTLSGGELELNFVSGEYTFLPTTGDASMPATVFTYLALDNDGDSAGGQVSISASTVQITEGTDQANTLTGADTPDRLLGGDANDTLAGGSGDDQLFGGNGNDTLLGELGNDILFGHGGDDELLGGLGQDQLQGGTGNDTLTGGGGSDTFIWRFSDADGGVDVITDWTSAATDAGGDRLDLRDLLQGEQGQDLSDYLHFETDGSDTTIRVSSDGDFSGGYSSSAVDHSIQLQGIDLTQGGSLSDTGIIQDLLNRGQLIVD